jgi:hypothetical protein
MRRGEQFRYPGFQCTFPCNGAQGTPIITQKLRDVEHHLRSEPVARHRSNAVMVNTWRSTLLIRPDSYHLRLIPWYPCLLPDFHAGTCSARAGGDGVGIDERLEVPLGIDDTESGMVR